MNIGIALGFLLLWSSLTLWTHALIYGIWTGSDRSWMWFVACEMRDAGVAAVAGLFTVVVSAVVSAIRVTK